MEDNFLHFTNSLNQIFCSIWYLERDRMITTVWKGMATDQSVRKIKARLLEMLQAKDTVVIMSDVQQFFSAPAELLRELGETDWDDSVNSLGVQMLVHVLKPDTELPQDQEATHPGGLTIKHFHNKIDALAWIKNQLRS